MNANVRADAQTSTEPRHELLLSSWLSLKLRPRDYLLGNVFSTTSRWLLFGETGVGKTVLGADIAGAVAAGRGLLGWAASERRSRVMYVDGELPAETFQERMRLVADRYGPDLTLFGYNRDALKDGDLPPLNTEEGQKWLWREIDAVQPDAIIFDSIMSLLAGSMSDEDSWEPIKTLGRQLSRRHMGQMWMHHTGHENGKGFGTKTREWEMDTVTSLTKANKDGSEICIEFTKARLRNPANRDQFETKTIRLDPDGWKIVGIGRKYPAASPSAGDGDTMRQAIVAAYSRLAGNAESSDAGGDVLIGRVLVDDIREEVKAGGFFDLDPKGHIISSSRTSFRRAKIELIDSGQFVERDGWIWFK